MGSIEKNDLSVGCVFLDAFNAAEGARLGGVALRGANDLPVGCDKTEAELVLSVEKYLVLGAEKMLCVYRGRILYMCCRIRFNAFNTVLTDLQRGVGPP